MSNKELYNINNYNEDIRSRRDEGGGIKPITHGQVERHALRNT